MNEIIKPSSDLRNHYNEISRLCREDKETVILTVNGKGDTVSMSYEEYKNLKTKLDLYEKLALSESDEKVGNVGPIEDTFRDLRKILKEEFNEI